MQNQKVTQSEIEKRAKRAAIKRLFAARAAGQNVVLNRTYDLVPSQIPFKA